MNLMLNLLETIAVIGGSDGPTVIFTTGNLPLPAICVSVFGVMFIAYVYIAKAIRSKRRPAEAVAAIPAQPAVNVSAQAVYTGPVLNGIDEQDAAVVMAIVSHKTGIPLERLKFDSITLKEDK